MPDLFGVPFLTYDDVVMASPIFSEGARNAISGCALLSDDKRMDVLEPYRQEILEGLCTLGMADPSVMAASDPVVQSIRRTYDEFTGGLKDDNLDVAAMCKALDKPDFYSWLYGAHDMSRRVHEICDKYGIVSNSMVQFLKQAPDGVPLSLYIDIAQPQYIYAREPDASAIMERCTVLENEGKLDDDVMIAAYIEEVLSANFTDNIHDWVRDTDGDTLLSMFIPKVFTMLGRPVHASEISLLSERLR